ncbi:uncharacterized protein [Paramisgurnus dabryanus]|uniref:uncharacterized protein n=1 Tax=Paramisgurnus dabryanus TaxID=90735 RepID=UPI0031F41B5A
MHTEHLKSVVQVPMSFKYEEPTTADAEELLIEDEELIKMVEMIISDEEEPESVTVEPKCKDTLVVDLIQDEQPLAETEKALDEEIADIVEEILQITEDQVTQQNVEENMRQTNEELRNMDTLDVAEAPETLSVESAVVVKDETAHVTVEDIFAANGKAAVDEESWVIIEEPITNHPYPAVDGPVTSPASEDERIGTESKSHLAESSELFSRLRSVCIEALVDSSCKPVSVDVCGNESTINITIEICPNDKYEFDNTAIVIAEDCDFIQKIQENGVHCSIVSQISCIRKNAAAWTNSQPC